MKSLKTWQKETLLKNLFRTSNRPKKSNGAYEWAVLVLDSRALEILQCCMQTHEIMAENVACIESIENTDRPCMDYHAIYFLSPVNFFENILYMYYN